MNIHQRSHRLFLSFCAITCLPVALVVGILVGVFQAPQFGVGALTGFCYGLLVMVLYVRYLHRFHPHLVEQANAEYLQAKGYTIYQPKVEEGTEPNP
ncbi:MAG: hypothetical protein ACR2PL_18250 [Dehalococcoidia bacterium]